jgi:protoporphyrinogen oxidase
MSSARLPVVIAGGGVAGLAAAYRLQGAHELPFVVFEKGGEVGGYSRTARYKDFRFDLGGHRFYTKKAGIQRLVEDVVGKDLLQVERLSRILFNGRFVDYPLSGANTLLALGPLGAVHGAFDYAAIKAHNLLFPPGPERTFEQWALNRFGNYLYRAYFKVYSEKTWGVPCTELSADFAEQRIKKLSLREVVRDAVLKKGEDESLVRRFVYPRYGFGQVPEGMASAVKPPNRILTGHAVTEVEHEDGRVTAVTVRTPEGSALRQPCCELVSSLPVTDLVGMLRPAAPPDVLDAARQLTYRSVVILLLVLDVPQVSPDHWIYVPDPAIGFCRLHEPKNWSADMAPPDRTALVLEYFCQEGDERWQRPADELAGEAAGDLAAMGLIQPGWASDFVRVPLPRAYPVYRLGYEAPLAVITSHLARFENLHNVGRNASFLYTSSDHYMDMGLKTAENLLGHAHDLASIGRERAYAEGWTKEEKAWS